MEGFVVDDVLWTVATSVQHLTVTVNAILVLLAVWFVFEVTK